MQITGREKNSESIYIFSSDSLVLSPNWLLLCGAPFFKVKKPPLETVTWGPEVFGFFFSGASFISWLLFFPKKKQNDGSSLFLAALDYCPHHKLQLSESWKRVISKCPDGNLEGQSPAPPFTRSCDANITDNSEFWRISPGLAVLRMKQRMLPRLGTHFLNLRANHTSPCHPTNLCSQSTGWRLWTESWEES